MKKGGYLPKFCRLLFVPISVRRPNLWLRSWRCLRTPASLADWPSAPSVSDHLAIVLAPYDNTKKQRHATAKRPVTRPRMWICSTAENTTIFVPSNIFPLRLVRQRWLLLLRTLFMMRDFFIFFRRIRKNKKSYELGISIIISSNLTHILMNNEAVFFRNWIIGLSLVKYSFEISNIFKKKRSSYSFRIDRITSELHWDEICIASSLELPCASDQSEALF